MELRELLHLLESSFADRSLEDGMTERQAQEIDDLRIPLPPEKQRGPESSIKDDWRKLPSVDESCFFEFDNKAWRYYLPIALRAALLSECRDLGTSLKFFLLPGQYVFDTRDYREWSPAEFINTRNFNSSQAHCIAKILQYLDLDLDSEEQIQLQKWLELYGGGV